MSSQPKEEIRTALLTVEALIERERVGCECAELRVLQRMTERLRAGLGEYGRLDDANGRNWVAEAFDENVDACVYLCREMERSGG
jgi:hypothetical protein